MAASAERSLGAVLLTVQNDGRVEALVLGSVKGQRSVDEFLAAAVRAMPLTGVKNAHS